MSRHPSPPLSGAVAAVTAVSALLLASCTEQPDIEVATSALPAATVTRTASAGPTGAPSETPAGTPTGAPAEPSSTTITATPTEEGTTVFVTIGPDSVTPIAERVDLSVDAPVTLDITSSRSAELHVSSSPERVVEVEPGHSTVDLSFAEAGSYEVSEPESDSLVLRLLVH